MRVKVTFLEQPIEKSSYYTKSVRSSTSFKKTLTDISGSARISLGVGLFSVSASAEFSKLSEDVLSSESNVEKEKSEETTFNTDFLQIIRELETTISVNGQSARSSEQKFVDSVPESEQTNYKQLNQRAVNFMKFNYGAGAVRNRFVETVCQKKKGSVDADQVSLIVEQ